VVRGGAAASLSIKRLKRENRINQILGRYGKLPHAREKYVTQQLDEEMRGCTVGAGYMSHCFRRRSRASCLTADVSRHRPAQRHLQRQRAFLLDINKYRHAGSNGMTNLGGCVNDA
jgi:hypothetical protein